MKWILFKAMVTLSSNPFMFYLSYLGFMSMTTSIITYEEIMNVL